MSQGAPERSFAMQSPASGSATGSQMSPPNMHSPAPSLARPQDSMNRAGSDDSYRGPDAKPYDMQNQGAGNFVPPPRPASYASFNNARPPLQNSPHMNN